MKTKITAVMLILMFSATIIYAQDQTKSNKKDTMTKTEKPSEMSNHSSDSHSMDMNMKDMNMKSGSDQNNMKKAEKMDQTKKESKEASVVYTCPMHPEVKSDTPGKCPKCGMNLVQKK